MGWARSDIARSRTFMIILILGRIKGDYQIYSRKSKHTLIYLTNRKGRDIPYVSGDGVSLTRARRSGMALNQFVRSVPEQAPPPSPRAASRRGYIPRDAHAPPLQMGTDSRECTTLPPLSLVPSDRLGH